MADIFEQFQPKAKAPDVERQYVAFKPVDKRQYRLRVRPAGDVWDRLPYRMLLRIMEPGQRGTSIALVFTFMAVEVIGRNLGDVAYAIERELCDFIEEFDPLRHDRPADPAAPFIEKIVLHAPPGMETMGQPAARSGAGKQSKQEEPA